jgi:hypothetical protein
LANAANSFKFKDVYANFIRTPGPILLIGQLQVNDKRHLEEKVAGRVVIHTCSSPEESTDVYDAVLNVVERHCNGEPQIPARLGVALLLVAKLERKHFWGGNAKNFLTVNSLAKGNGLDERYAALAKEIAEYLSSEHRAVRLLTCKTGDGYPKFACNNGDRNAVYEFLRTRKVPSERMMNWLNSGGQYISAQELAEITPEAYAEEQL